jgi:hypothetical protein
MMTHQDYKNLLVLSGYDELDEDTRLLLQSHLDACIECRKEKERLEKFRELATVHRPTVLSEEMLLQARRERRVSAALRNERGRSFESIFGGLFVSPLRSAVAGVVLLIVGLGVGFFAFRSSDHENRRMPLEFGLARISDDSPEPSAMRIQNLRFIRRDVKTGEVEVEFDAVAPISVKGNVDDENIQRILARALVSESNTGMRLRAASMISDPTSRRSDVDQNVKIALISALKYDENLGVRKEALAVLRNYLPDDDAMGAIVYVLNHEKNTGLRIAAINSLDMTKFSGRKPSQEILQGLKTAVASEENNYIRIRTQEALKEVQQ